jgi:thiamine biosynthesis protein ThiS
LTWKFPKTKGIAIAINDTVIPKSNWNSHPLKETDTVLIIFATQEANWLLGGSIGD